MTQAFKDIIELHKKVEKEWSEKDNCIDKYKKYKKMLGKPVINVEEEEKKLQSIKETEYELARYKVDYSCSK